MSRKVPPWAHSARPTARISTTLTKSPISVSSHAPRRRLVQPRAREHRRAAVEHDVALQHREADHDVGRRAGRDHQRAVDADESGRQRQQRRRDGQVREQQAREQRRQLVVDHPIEDADRVALQIAEHGIARGAARGAVHDPDALPRSVQAAARPCRRRRWSSPRPAPPPARRARPPRRHPSRAVRYSAAAGAAARRCRRWR